MDKVRWNILEEFSPKVNKRENKEKQHMFF